MLACPLEGLTAWPSLCSGLWPWSLRQLPTPNSMGFIFHPTTEGWWPRDPELLASSELQFPLLQSGANRDCSGRSQDEVSVRWLGAWHCAQHAGALNRVPVTVTVTVTPPGPQSLDGCSGGWVEPLLLEVSHVHPASCTHSFLCWTEDHPPTPGTSLSSESA